jgi:hypothetical protein
MPEQENEFQGLLHEISMMFYMHYAILHVVTDESIKMNSKDYCLPL